MKSALLAIVLAVLVPAAATIGLIGAFPAARAHPPSIVNQAGEKIVADEVRAFRREMAAAIKQKDAARLRQMYAPSFVHTLPIGKSQERDARIGAVLSGASVIETVDASDVEVRIPIDWVAVVTGTAATKTVADALPQRVRWMAVYTRTDKSWWLVASQETPLGAP